MQITLPKWLGLLTMVILQPGISAFCATYLMVYSDLKIHHFVAGLIAYKACIEARNTYRRVRDAG